MPSDDIREIELNRLHELEKQAAYHGPNTAPEILIEIQELHNRYPGTPRNGRRHGAPERSKAQSEMDFVMNAVGAALRRITLIEQGQVDADGHRTQLDRKLDRLLDAIPEARRWGRVITGAALLALFIAIVVAVKVF